MQNNYTMQVLFVKDLSRIGRDLEKTIIIDNLKENFCWQPSNGIHILTWYDDESDEELLKISNFLKQAIDLGCTDVREALVEYNNSWVNLNLKIQSVYINFEVKVVCFRVVVAKRPLETAKSLQKLQIYF